MNPILPSLLRRVVPRALRNWIRTPQVTGQRIFDSVRYACGLRTRIQVQPGLTVIAVCRLVARKPKGPSGFIDARPGNPERS